MDREVREPLELLDEIESILNIHCAPVTWPIGMGSRLKGVYHLVEDEVHLYEPGRNFTRQDSTIFQGLDDPALAARLGTDVLAELREAAVLASQGKTADAVKVYDAVAATATADQSLRDLASIRAAVALADTADVADLVARLKPFDADGNAWRHVAREVMASAHWRLKDYAAADAQVQAMLGDPETPASLRQRAQMMAQLLQPLVAAK